MSEFTKGPVRRLKAGITRYELVYRRNDGNGWKVHRMWRTAPEGRADDIGKALYQRLKARPAPFEVISVRDVGNEVPVGSSGPSEVVSPAEYELQRERDRAKYSKSEIRERAKELGLWYPGMEEKFDA